MLGSLGSSLDLCSRHCAPQPAEFRLIAGARRCCRSGFGRRSSAASASSNWPARRQASARKPATRYQQAPHRSRSRRSRSGLQLRDPLQLADQPTKARPRHIVASATQPTCDARSASTIAASARPRALELASEGVQRRREAQGGSQAMGGAMAVAQGQTGLRRSPGAVGEAEEPQRPGRITAGTRSRRAPCKGESEQDPPRPPATASSIAMPSFERAARIGEPAEEKQRCASSAAGQDARRHRRSPSSSREHDQRARTNHRRAAVRPRSEVAVPQPAQDRKQLGRAAELFAQRRCPAVGSLDLRRRVALDPISDHDRHPESNSTRGAPMRLGSAPMSSSPLLRWTIASTFAERPAASSPARRQ